MNTQSGITGANSIVADSKDRRENKQVGAVYCNDLDTSVCWNELMLDEDDYINVTSLESSKLSATSANELPDANATIAANRDVTGGSKIRGVKDLNIEVTYQNVIRPRRDVTISSEKERNVKYIRVHDDKASDCSASYDVTSSKSDDTTITNDYHKTTAANEEPSPISSNKIVQTLDKVPNRPFADSGSIPESLQTTPFIGPRTSHNWQNIQVQHEKVKTNENDVNNSVIVRTIPVLSKADNSEPMHAGVAQQGGGKGVTYSGSLTDTIPLRIPATSRTANIELQVIV